MTLDLDELERKAKAALSANPTAYAGICAMEDWRDAVSPSVVLALIERVRKLEKKLAEAPENWENGEAFEKDINA